MMRGAGSKVEAEERSHIWVCNYGVTLRQQDGATVFRWTVVMSLWTQHPPVRKISPVEQHLLISLHHRTHPLLWTKKREIHQHKVRTQKKQQTMCLTTTSEASPSSRLVGIGTTTCELAALSSVTEPCNRKSTVVNLTSSVHRGTTQGLFFFLPTWGNTLSV